MHGLARRHSAPKIEDKLRNRVRRKPPIQPADGSLSIKLLNFPICRMPSKRGSVRIHTLDSSRYSNASSSSDIAAPIAPTDAAKVAFAKCVDRTPPSFLIFSARVLSPAHASISARAKTRSGMRPVIRSISVSTVNDGIGRSAKASLSAQKTIASTDWVMWCLSATNASYRLAWK